MQQAHEMLQERFGTEIDRSQVINWMWYDVLTYSSAATVQMTFFNALRATRNLGNMELPGQLAGRKAFIIRALRVHMRRAPTQLQVTPHASNDISLLADNGWAEFEVGQKNFGVWPIAALPGGAGAWSDSAGAGGEAANEFHVNAAHGIPDIRAVYTLSLPLLIEPQMNFNFTLNWNAAQTLSADVDIMVMLDGELWRPVQ